MAEPITFVSVLASISNLFLGFRTKADRLSDHQEKTLIAVSKAFHETSKYYIYLETKERDEQREWSLAQLWHEAAILLKRYDGDLYHRLNLKSRYWRSPENLDRRGSFCGPHRTFKGQNRSRYALG